MFHKTTLANGLRVLTCPMPHLQSVAVQVFIGAGSRYEAAERAGVYHFLEHVLFKGTARWPSAQAVSEAIEGIGGVLNGGTDRELTVYWCKVARYHLDLAVNLLADLVRHPLMAADDVEKERSVILDELNMAHDSPQQRVGLLLDELMWPDQPLGRDVAGTRESVGAIDRDALVATLAQQYVPNNIVVSVAGAVEPDEVVALLDGAFGDWAPGQPSPLIAAGPNAVGARLGTDSRRTEQVYLSLGLPGVSYMSDDRYAVDLLNIILGEGMSSRLFMEVRERLGLAYDVHSYVSHFRDAGDVVVFACTDPAKVTAALTAVLGELGRVRLGVGDAELGKAKEMAKGRLLLRLEDTRSVAGFYGAQELLLGQVRTADEVAALADAVTAADIARVANAVFGADHLKLALVGPMRQARRLERLLKL